MIDLASLSSLDATILQIQSLAQHKHFTLAFAESCTGGLLSSHVTQFGGVSSFYAGSLVTYSNASKQILLDVKIQSLVQYGAVSLEVALEMAQGVKNKLQVDYGIAITGIAGPTGATETKPVGTVCFAVAGPEGRSLQRLQYFKGDRRQIQYQSALFALNLFLELLAP